MPLFLAYFLKTLSFLGYRPNCAGCIGCGKAREDIRPDEKNRLVLSPKRGGLVCETCQMAGEYYIRLHSARLEVLSRLQRSSLAEAIKIKIGFHSKTATIARITQKLHKKPMIAPIIGTSSKKWNIIGRKGIFTWLPIIMLARLPMSNIFHHLSYLSASGGKYPKLP